MKKSNGTRNRKMHTANYSHKQANLFPSDDRPETALQSSLGECEIVSVGKRRDGGTRYWCLRHKADATAKYGKRAKSCRAAHIPPIGPEDTLKLSIDKYKGGIALWGAVPAVYDTTRLAMDRGIHVHTRVTPEAKKETDYTFRAVRITAHDLPENGILVSELDAIYYMASSVFGFEMRNVLCSYCGYPHLDRDWFSVHPHRRHLCAGCGKNFRDTETSVGNPILGLRNACGIKTKTPKLSEKTLDIKQADFPGGIQVWGSNPSFLWTSDRQEEEGIHVHAFRKSGPEPDLDETYGEVTIDGVNLDAAMVRALMAQNTLPSLKGRIQSINCPSCHKAQFDVGELAFTPTSTHICKYCGHEFTTAGRLRKTIANPLLGILAELAKMAPRQPQHHDLNLIPETL